MGIITKKPVGLPDIELSSITKSGLKKKNKNLTLLLIFFIILFIAIALLVS